MTWWRIAGSVVFVVIFVVAAALQRKSRRAQLVLEGMVRGVFCGAPVWIGSIIAGSVGVWCGIPLGVAVGWAGKSPLGMLNFLVLQWFGIRLQAEFSREEWLRGVRGRWWASDAPKNGPIAWSLLRWVWPFTGWWSACRYIRRPTS